MSAFATVLGLPEQIELVVNREGELTAVRVGFKLYMLDPAPEYDNIEASESAHVFYAEQKCSMCENRAATLCRNCR